MRVIRPWASGAAITAPHAETATSHLVAVIRCLLSVGMNGRANGALKLDKRKTRGAAQQHPIGTPTAWVPSGDGARAENHRTRRCGPRAGTLVADVRGAAQESES